MSDGEGLSVQNRNLPGELDQRSLRTVVHERCKRSCGVFDDIECGAAGEPGANRNTCAAEVERSGYVEIHVRAGTWNVGRNGILRNCFRNVPEFATGCIGEERDS